MMIFSNTEEPVNYRQIEDVENRVGLTFPEEYKKHLLKYNGGQCSPNIFSFIERGEKSVSNIDWFLAVCKSEYDNLENYISIYKLEDKRLPQHIFPFAHDPGGNLICISCGTRDYGHVYFWDHEREVNYNIASDDDYSNLYPIASSFNAFLESLNKDDIL